MSIEDRFKFRAKLKNMDKWIYGAYLKMLPYQPNPVGERKPLEKEYEHLIIVEERADWGMPRGIAAYAVIPETVGQCTGLKDKNGKLIYEGDIVTYEWLTPIGKVWRSDGKHIVEWNDGYCILSNIAKYDVEYGTKRNVQVIGNIYENKELLDE